MQTNNIIFNACSSNLVYALSQNLCELKDKPIIMCIGSNKIIADSLGPLVGHLLTTQYNIKTYVYGTLNRPINATNIEFYFNYINKTHKGAKLLVIDASIGLFEQVGAITLKKGGIIPACLNLSAIKKMGDISITGVVLEKGFRTKLLLKTTKLNFVYNMAQEIAKIVNQAFNITY